MSKRLMALGYRDVRTLTGGMRAWKSDGNPIETAD
jgi:3-mercaptopyruvate sulfurtransferase SseA